MNTGTPLPSVIHVRPGGAPPPHPQQYRVRRSGGVYPVIFSGTPDTGFPRCPARLREEYGRIPLRSPRSQLGFLPGAVVETDQNHRRHSVTGTQIADVGGRVVSDPAATCA